MQDIIIKNLSVGYGNKLLIDTFSLQLCNPAFVAIIGLNGSGKTTFLKSIAGKIPFAGEVSLPRSTSYLGQKNHINFPISVEEMLLMGLFRHKHFAEAYTEEDRKQVRTLLEEILAEDLYSRKFNELSGGEQQILWLCQTLLQNQEVILLDEPTQQLDLLNKKMVFDLLNRQVCAFNRTVFCVTHDVYNLKSITGGYLINFSKPKPKLENLSEQTIYENIGFLEQEAVPTPSKTS